MKYPRMASVSILYRNNPLVVPIHISLFLRWMTLMDAPPDSNSKVEDIIAGSCFSSLASSIRYIPFYNLSINIHQFHKWY